jgi:Na+/H+ antiporter NhaA
VSTAEEPQQSGTPRGRAARDAFTGRTAWARNLAAPLRDFLSRETGGAVVLLAAVVVALLWANFPSSDSYESLWTTKLSIQLGSGGISMDLREWINEGLMTFFFLVVGLEARREFDTGDFRDRRRLALPVAAALGGMAVPVLIYLAFNAGGDGAHGWGAAMSTDTALALGVLGLVAPAGTRLRVRLLTLAVVDDLVALIVIATVYSNSISAMPLALALLFFALFVSLRYVEAEWRRPAGALLGVAFWVALLESGIDPVVAGLAIGLSTTAYRPAREDLERVTELTRSFREQPTPELARTAQRSVSSAISANERLQHELHPWTSYVIVPLFGLANAGVRIDGALLSAAVTSPVTLGIFFGYVVGKPAGITGTIWLTSRNWVAGLQRALSWPVIAGGGTVAGIGFTVSVLIASRAFAGQPQTLDEAKIGVLAAGVVSALLAWLVFGVIRRLPTEVRARQISETSEELLDLSEDVDPERDHIRGSESAPVTLVEYGDYECPYCGRAEPVVRALLDSFGDEIRYVWRHLPLTDVHPNAQMAAEAAEAAAAQGAFWEMNDKLLANQDALGAEDLVRYAEEIGVDRKRFWDELRHRTYADRVEDDVASADESGVAGTPSFFVNGRRHQGAYDVESLSSAVERARRAALLRGRARPPAELEGAGRRA